MEALKYFKLDLRTIKNSRMGYQIILILCACTFILLSSSYKFGMSYLLLCLVIFATIPFSLETSEKSEIIHYILPSKISKMVLGRFIYLIILSSIVFLVNGFLMFNLYNNNSMSMIEVVIMFTTCILAIAVCFCQYSIYYKFGIEQGKLLSMLLYFVPAFIVFMIPTFLDKDRLNILENLEKNINFFINNKSILFIIAIIIVVIIGTINYFISCRICKNKEI